MGKLNIKVIFNSYVMLVYQRVRGFEVAISWEIHRDSCGILMIQWGLNAILVLNQFVCNAGDIVNKKQQYVMMGYPGESN